jgi:hypothetical protein
MPSDQDFVRWVAPATQSSHRALALVRHEDRLFSFSELLRHVPKRQAFMALQSAGGSPQDWWDMLVREWPVIARRAADRSEPRDNEVLDLLVLPHEGCA